MDREFIADIARPPMGRIGLQNLYVILSRATSFDKLIILRPFDDETFVAQPNDNLEAVDRWLEERNEQFKSEYECSRRNG